MQKWVQDAVRELRTKIQNDNTLVQVQRDNLLGFVTQQASSIPPVGLMSEAAMSWGPRYAVLTSF